MQVAAAGRRGGKVGPILALIALGPIALFCGLTALVLCLALLDDRSDLGVSIGVIGFFAVLTALAVWGVIRAARRLARR